MNHFIRFCFSNGSAHIFSKRFLTTLRRKYPIQSPSMLWTEGYMPPLTVREQVYEEVPSDASPNSLLNVLLTSDVPGLGSKGSVVSVHRNRFWRYLHILGLAELPTPERIAYFQAQSTYTLVLSGDSYESEQRLRSMTLYIPMNPTKDWTLDKTHVKVAFRKYGIQLDEDCITLPEEPITRDSPSLLFNVYIKIDGIADVPVPCRIFLYQRLDKVTCTQPPSNVFKTITVDDWSADFPESDVRSVDL